MDYAHTNLAVNLLVPSFKSIYTSTNHVLDTLDIFLKQVQKVTFWNLIYSVPVLKEVDSLFCSIWGSYKDLKWQVISDIFLANNFFSLERTYYVPLRHHLGWTKENFGWSSPKKVARHCTCTCNQLAISRWEIEQLGISFGSTFLLFPVKIAKKSYP